MPRLAVASPARSFQKNNRPFFYLADTVWSAFTEAEEEERNIFRPTLTSSSGQSTLEMPELNSDCLLIGTRIQIASV